MATATLSDDQLGDLLDLIRDADTAAAETRAFLSRRGIDLSARVQPA
jgi:hypothetical protein